MNERVPAAMVQAVTPFLQVFAACYVLMTALVYAVLYFTGLPSNAGVGVGILIGSGVFAAQRFYRVTGRLPQGREKTKLIFGSFAVAVLLSSALLGLGSALGLIDARALVRLLSDLTHQIGLAGWAGIIAVITSAHLMALWLSYGPMATWMIRIEDKDKGGGSKG